MSDKSLLCAVRIGRDFLLSEVKALRKAMVLYHPYCASPINVKAAQSLGNGCCFIVVNIACRNA